MATDFISFLDCAGRGRETTARANGVSVSKGTGVSGGEDQPKACGGKGQQLELSEQGYAPPLKELFSVKPAQVGSCD